MLLNFAAPLSLEILLGCELQLSLVLLFHFAIPASVCVHSHHGLEIGYAWLLASALDSPFPDAKIQSDGGLLHREIALEFVQLHQFALQFVLVSLPFLILTFDDLWRRENVLVFARLRWILLVPFPTF